MKEKKYTIAELRYLMSDFIEREYPKGENKDRGTAILAITLFIYSLLKLELKK